MTRVSERLEQEITAVVDEASAPLRDRAFANASAVQAKYFSEVKTLPQRQETYRWIGKCKKCGAKHQLSGKLGFAYRHDAQGKVHAIGEAAIADEGVYLVGDLGSNPTKIVIPCGGHYCALQRVYDDAKPGKPRTACGARCMNSTGPACDCRCRGQNHGSNLPI